MDKHKAKELARIHEVIHKKWVKKQKEQGIKPRTWEEIINYTV